jgi:hypothetical protein
MLSKLGLDGWPGAVLAIVSVANPGLALIQAPHFMLGADRKLDAHWNLTGAVEYLPKQTATNPSVNPVFGGNMTESEIGLVFHFMLSRIW